jgi:integrase
MSRAHRRANSEGSIYRRQSDGRWVGTISLERGRRKSFYGQSREAVHGKLTAALGSRQNGQPIPAENLSVARFLAIWLESVSHSVRPKTFEAYELNVRRVIPYIGALKVARISPANVQDCYNSLLRRGLSRRSVEQAHAVLHRACRQALLWGHISRNPTEAVNVPRPGRREVRALTEEQINTLFAATTDDGCHSLWVLLITTGMRIGEALGLKWTDLDLSGGRVRIQRALQRQRGRGLQFVEPKSGHSVRTVHLAAHAVQTLSDHRRRQLEQRMRAGPNWIDFELVFCGSAGTPIDPPVISKELHEALARAGLPRVRVHDLRHSCASYLLAKGTSPKVVQELLGHSTVTLTLNTYSHTLPTLHAEAARHMDDLFRAV